MTPPAGARSSADGHEAAAQRLTLRVHAKNPAIRIQIIGEDRRIHLAEPATGDARITVQPGAYTVLYWLGTSAVREVPVRLMEASTVELDWDAPRATLSASDAPEKRKSVDRSMQCFNFTIDGRDVAEVWVQLLTPTDGSQHRADDGGSNAWPRLFVARPGQRPAPIPMRRASRKPIRRHVPLDGPPARNALELITLGRSLESFDGLSRSIPVIEGLSPFISIVRREPRVPLGHERATSVESLARDWRFARYWLQLVNADRPAGEALDDAVAGEALVDRLGEPGRLPIPDGSITGTRTRTNVLATVAEWLLAARGLEQSSRRKRHLHSALIDGILNDDPLSALPDVQALQFLVRATVTPSAIMKRQPFKLGTPVFSESWRALSRVPLAVWMEHEILTSSATRETAQSAVVGGVWFAWNTSLEPDVVRPADARVNLSAAFGDALKAVGELSETVQASLLEPKDSAGYFTQVMEWGKRSPLERRILNYFTAPIGPEQEGKVAEEFVLEDLARELAMPLPFVADSVRTIVRGTDNTSTPIRNPLDSPSGAEAPAVRREQVYAME